MKHKLSTRLAFPKNLSETDINTLFTLYSTYYDGSNTTLFKGDLLEKDYILQLLDESDSIRGFSTLKIIPFQHAGKPARAVFSGDTIISHHFWGEQTLPLAWCELVGRIKAQQPDTPLYWLLIVKGDRTYRYLNVFSKTYYPSRHYPTPPDVQAMIDHLAQQRFGNDYYPEEGLIRFEHSHGHLKPEWLNKEKSGKPEARFFASRNPRHAEGEELVCLTRLEEDNLRSFALTGFKKGLKAGPLPE